ncbi:PspC domain-containing protein [Hymenobacter puniceus]|uniref:PspC domain-containing protein n=1 Tax=Hymenobacter sp. BT190 TaxID=2763505 RepID=UPI0016517236|nr:PspC domain-containing protein [Hymenobacter sp. BT190]MBC6698391.1 PspC domain-containing protein [Hymenobacter sp. BT190]
MKKNISINLQGMIFHLEEDGYDVLGRYLAEVKAHFSGYRGHEEIVADIESRIAELFAARLSVTKQVITLEDVDAMTAKMGRVSDFQSADDADEDDELLAGAVASGTAQGTYAGGNSYTGPAAAAAATAAAADTEPRQLVRDMSHRKVAGVCAGLAQYFRINAVWVRLLALASLFSPVIGDFIGFLPGVVLVSYVVLWIVLPKRYDVPETADANEKQLFRDTDTGKIGGVAAGVAAYLGTDVSLVRILFLLGAFFGFGLILYIILWIAVPEAKTVADRMRMRGDALTLSGIASNARDYDATTGNRRPLGTFFEDLAGALNPLLSFVGTALRIFAGVLLSVIGFSLLLGFTVTLGVVLGLIPESQNPTIGNPGFLKLLHEQPTWAWLASYVAAAIPSLGMLLVGVGLLVRRSFINRTVGWSMFGLWLLGVIGITVAVARQSREFQYSADVEQTTSYPTLTAPVLRLETRHLDRDSDQNVGVQLAAADSGQVVQVLRRISAKGTSETEAARTAGNSLAYTVRTRGDSVLLLDDHYSFQPNARFRDQDLELTIRLPRNRTFRLSNDAAYWIGGENFAGGRVPDNVERHKFQLRGNDLECLDCTTDELGLSDSEDEDNASNDEMADDDDMDVDIDSDDDDVNVNLNYGGAASFNLNEDFYGPDRQTYTEDGFRAVSVMGSYRVVIREGSTFRVSAAGAARDLRDLKIDQEGDELLVRPRGRINFGSNWRANDSKVLVTIEMPNLDKLNLAGAVRADVRGFSDDSRLEVVQAGASDLRLNGTFNNLDLELAGKCRTSLEGSAGNLNVDAAGACSIVAADFPTRIADVDLAGISKARLNVTETLKADAIGASIVQYSGNPRNVEKDVIGASRVSAVSN